MKTKLKIAIGIVFVILSVLTMGTKIWADSKAFSIEGPSFMRITPQGDLAIIIGRQVFIIDSNGITKKVINLESLGIQNHGDFDFFNNGDLLIYNGEAEFTFTESIERYIRRQDKRISPPTGKKGLLRCNSDGTDCYKFSAELPAFHSAFRVYIDRDTETVYIADTPRFALYKLNEKGKIIATNKDKLRFPNQLMLHDDKLYVANTNYHSIKIVSSDTESFGEEIESHKTVIDKINEWPSQLLNAHDNWWVMIAGDDMSYGRIQIYDSEWKPLSRPKLDADSDPMGIVYYSDEILVADWSNYKIYRFDPSGKQKSDYTNKEIDALTNNMNNQKMYYKSISSYSLIGFIIVIILGFIIAYRLEKQQTTKILKDTFIGMPETIDADESQVPPGDDIYWIESKANRFGITASDSFRNCAMIALVITAYLVLIVNQQLLSWGEHAAVFIIVTFAAYQYRQWQKIIRVKIGVQGDYLFIDDGSGRVVSGKDKAIKFGRDVLVIDDQIALYKSLNRPIFPVEDFEQWVLPRMQKGQPISVWESMRIQWKQKHPNILRNLLTLSAFILIAIIVYGLKKNGVNT